MTTLEFTGKYCGFHVLSFCQRTIDLMQDVEDMLTNDNDMPLEHRKGACHYSIEIELEVMDEALPDYKFLEEALADVKLIYE